MSAPSDNPFAVPSPPEFAPVEVVEEEQRQFDEESAVKLSQCWAPAAVAGLCFLASGIGVGLGVYFTLPFPHYVPRFICATIVSGMIVLPSFAILLFATSAFQLRRSADLERFVLTTGRQRLAITAICTGILGTLAIFFFLMMTNFYAFYYDI